MEESFDELVEALRDCKWAYNGLKEAIMKSDDDIIDTLMFIRTLGEALDDIEMLMDDLGTFI